MPKFKYQKLCFSCGTPIQSNRNDKVYCSEKCCTYSTRMRLKHAPHLSTKEWVASVEEGLLNSPLSSLSHPVKYHPFNTLAPKLFELEEQIKALLPTASGAV